MDKKQLFRQIEESLNVYSKEEETIWSELYAKKVEEIVDSMIENGFPMSKVPTKFMLSHPDAFLRYAETSVKALAIDLAFVDKKWITTYPWDFVNLSKIAIKENNSAKYLAQDCILGAFHEDNEEAWQYIDEINSFTLNLKDERVK